MGRKLLLLAVLAAALAAPGTAAATSWYPHPADAEWVWEWSNSAYNPVATKEKVTVREQRGTLFVLQWTTEDLGNPAEAPGSVGQVVLQETTSGLVNPHPGWESTPPPAQFPILCGQITRCGNSLASSLYLLIWGNRAPVLSQPLVKGATWFGTGGADGDVTSASRYVGRERITVPAFEEPVVAAKVRTDLTQAGALGDPFGSGVRTVWWVYGVGPVKILFEHAGGTDAPVTQSVLQSTNQTPAMPPPDANWFPLTRGKTQRFRWTNSKHMKQASIQDFTVEESVNNSARVAVKHVRGPIRIAGSYGFTSRTDGLVGIWVDTKAVAKPRFPKLGPRSRPVSERRHFFTPYDLLAYGTNPILPVYPAKGRSWAAKASGRDYSIFGVTGGSKVLGMRTVKVPAGRFSALAVQSTFRQKGFAFGSGRRTSYFVAGRGLVKIVFRHGDGSVSVAELVR